MLTSNKCLDLLVRYLQLSDIDESVAETSFFITRHFYLKISFTKPEHCKMNTAGLKKKEIK